MLLGPFLERMRRTSARRASTVWDRATVAAVVAGLVAVVVIVWDWNGWDRASISGSKQCALAAFGALMAAELMLGLGIVAGEVSPGAGAGARQEDARCAAGNPAFECGNRAGHAGGGPGQVVDVLGGGAAGARFDRLSWGRRSAAGASRLRRSGHDVVYRGGDLDGGLGCRAYRPAVARDGHGSGDDLVDLAPLLGALPAQALAGRRAVGWWGLLSGCSTARRSGSD